MKAIIMTADNNNANRVYTAEMRQIINEQYGLFDAVICKKNIQKYITELQNVQYIFATWGMEHFTTEEIQSYFPSLKAVFYSAGSVHYFAQEFLQCGIRVFSSWQANGVAVSEYTYAQILLTLKGFFRSERKAKYMYYSAKKYSEKCGGNYRATIGIIGVGSIGKAVAEKLKQNEVKVVYYDPYLDEEQAKSLNISPMSLEEIFSKCDVITNHLANKKQLEKIFNYKLFGLMKPYSTFINTGRGKQVDEWSLAKAMRKDRTRTALLDVTEKEPISCLSPLFWQKNIIITPHIAGSLGREVERMAKYMLEECQRLEKGQDCAYEVTMAMLDTMA